MYLTILKMNNATCTYLKNKQPGCLVIFIQLVGPETENWPYRSVAVPGRDTLLSKVSGRSLSSLVSNKACVSSV